MTSYQYMSHTEKLVQWLMHTRRGAVMLWIIERTAFLLGMCAAAFITWNIESRMFPVITDWTINPVVREADRYVLSGTLNKNRACTLIATSIMAVPKAPLIPRITLYQIKPNEIDGGNVPTGASTWGPWVMDIPKAFIENRDKIAWIEIIGHHRCHGLWDQETNYGSIRMDQLP